MDHFEKVEKLREHTNISYAEAKEALENSNWDLLDAMVYLEQHGKTEEGPQAYSSKAEEAPPEPMGSSSSNFGDFCRTVGSWIRRLITAGNQNHLQVLRHGVEETSISITVFVTLLILGFWVILPLMLVGLFFGFGYRFIGPHLGREEVNHVMEKASSVAEDIKQEVKEEIDKSKNKNQPS